MPIAGGSAPSMTRSWPASPGIGLIPQPSDTVSSRHLYQVRIARRDAAIPFLNGHRIFPGVHYRDNTQYQVYIEAQGTCPEAARAGDEVLSLPLHLGVAEDDARRVAGVLRQFVADAA